MQGIIGQETWSFNYGSLSLYKTRNFTTLKEEGAQTKSSPHPSLLSKPVALETNVMVKMVA